MTARNLVYVFCYDIHHDSKRAKVADILGEWLVRVQDSVFEGHLSRAQANRLFASARNTIGPGDSLRAYAITSDGLDASLAAGPAPLPERQPFLLL